MPAKNNPRPLTEKNFNNVKLDKVKEYYYLLNEELKLGYTKIVNGKKKTYIDRILPILNDENNLYYFYEGKVINDDNIRNFIERVKPRYLQPTINNDIVIEEEEEEVETNNDSISTTTSSEDRPNDRKLSHSFFNVVNRRRREEPLRVPSDFVLPPIPHRSNTPPPNVRRRIQLNENNILFSRQMTNATNPQEITNLIEQAINRFNELSITPITQQDLTGNPQTDLTMLMNKFANMQTRHASNGKSTSKLGMNQLAQIILNLQRDVKRVSKAISEQGARDIVEKHNAKYPEGSASRWKLTNNDVNNDGIPDIIIRNSNNEPLYVNGYTTTKSDYPIRYEFFKDFPESEQRKQALEHHGSLSNYAKEKFNVAYNDNFDEDLHKLGNMLTYEKPHSWANYKLKNYKGFPKEMKPLSAFDRFKRYVIGDKINDVLEEFKESRRCIIPGKYKIRVISKAVAALWNEYIISRVAQRLNISINSEAMEKYKKSKDGKAEINSLVSELINHLYLVNNEVGWTEERQTQLRNGLWDDMNDATYHFAEEVVPAEIFHGTIGEGDNAIQYNVGHAQHYPENHRNHEFQSHAYNQDTYGEFGAEDYQHPPLGFEFH